MSPITVLAQLQSALWLICCSIILSSSYEYELLKPEEDLEITEHESVEVMIGLAAADQDRNDMFQMRLGSACLDTPGMRMYLVPFCPPEIRNKTCIRYIVQIPGKIELNNTSVGLCVIKSHLIQEHHYMYRIRVVPHAERTDPSPETTGSPTTEGPTTESSSTVRQTFTEAQSNESNATDSVAIPILVTAVAVLLVIAVGLFVVVVTLSVVVIKYVWRRRSQVDMNVSEVPMTSNTKLNPDP